MLGELEAETSFHHELLRDVMQKDRVLRREGFESDAVDVYEKLSERLRVGQLRLADTQAMLDRQSSVLEHVERSHVDLYRQRVSLRKTMRRLNSEHMLYPNAIDFAHIVENHSVFFFQCEGCFCSPAR